MNVDDIGTTEGKNAGSKIVHARENTRAIEGVPAQSIENDVLCPVPNDVREFEEESESQVVRPSAPTRGTQFVPQYSSSSEDNNEDLEDATVNIKNSNELDIIGGGRTDEFLLPQVFHLFNGLEFNYRIGLANKGEWVVREATDIQEAPTANNAN